MIRLTIDKQEVIVTEGTTVLQAAAKLGIEIPAMCYKSGYTCHPSCMVCMVKDLKKDTFFPSCSMPVSEDMEIDTVSGEVISMRRESLELLLSDHVGDCEAPCTLTCPAGMDIPLMNRMIAKGNFNKALEVVHRKIALPATLGYICPAPCEKACRRKNMDGPVSICLLKRSASLESKHLPELNSKTSFSGKKVAIAGAGPAALSAAFYLLKAGYGCTLFFREKLPGGTLLSLVSSEKLPAEALEHDINIISNMGAHFRSEYNITSETFENELVKNFDAVVIATGKQSESPLETFGLSDSFTANPGNLQKTNTSRKGVFLCGNILKETRMAVKAVAQGKSAATEAIRYLKGLPQGEPPFFNSAFGQLMQEEFAEYQVESHTSTPVVPQAGFPGGFSREEAISEALRCMHCDCRKPQSCQLRKYAAEYGANRRKHSDGKRSRIKKYFQHQTIVYEPEKCIRCGLCVEISSRDETLGLTYIGRGFDVRIGVPYNENISHALQVTAVNCAAMCPTGALSLKNQEERI